MNFETWLNINERPLWDSMSRTDLIKIAWQASAENSRQQAISDSIEYIKAQGAIDVGGYKVYDIQDCDIEELAKLKEKP